MIPLNESKARNDDLKVTVNLQSRVILGVILGVGHWQLKYINLWNATILALPDGP